MKTNKNKPNAELLNYSAPELRSAANWVDRSNNVHPTLDLGLLFNKLNLLDAELTIFNVGEQDEFKYTSVVSFYLENEQRQVERYFRSITELSTSIRLGPVDLLWKDNLFFKAKSGNLPAIIIDESVTNNTITIEVPDIKLMQLVYLNGAESVLCNNKLGQTAGQIKLGKAI